MSRDGGEIHPNMSMRDAERAAPGLGVKVTRRGASLVFALGSRRVTMDATRKDAGGPVVSLLRAAARLLPQPVPVVSDRPVVPRRRSREELERERQRQMFLSEKTKPEPPPQRPQVPPTPVPAVPEVPAAPPVPPAPSVPLVESRLPSRPKAPQPPVLPKAEPVREKAESPDFPAAGEFEAVARSAAALLLRSGIPGGTRARLVRSLLASVASEA